MPCLRQEKTQSIFLTILTSLLFHKSALQLVPLPCVECKYKKPHRTGGPVEFSQGQGLLPGGLSCPVRSTWAYLCAPGSHAREWAWEARRCLHSLLKLNPLQILTRQAQGHYLKCIWCQVHAFWNPHICTLVSKLLYLSQKMSEMPWSYLIPLLPCKCLICSLTLYSWKDGHLI